MSRQTVRAAIQSYLTTNIGLPTALITNLSTVFSYPPKLTPEGDFFAGQDPGHQAGAVIYLWIESQSEKRIELRGATGGGKMVTYRFALDCYFRSYSKKAEDAALANEQFIDSLVAAIRASKTAGTTDGTVFQWGEGSTLGGQDVDVETFYPKMLGGTFSGTQTYSSVKVTALEQIVN